MKGTYNYFDWVIVILGAIAGFAISQAIFTKDAKSNPELTTYWTGHCIFGGNIGNYPWFGPEQVAHVEKELGFRSDGAVVWRKFVEGNPLANYESTIPESTTNKEELEKIEVTGTGPFVTDEQNFVVNSDPKIEDQTLTFEGTSSPSYMKFEISDAVLGEIATYSVINFGGERGSIDINFDTGEVNLHGLDSNEAAALFWESVLKINPLKNNK